MNESPASSGTADCITQIPGHVLDLYKEICANIRDTDEISFKLLRIVPLSSGLGAGALVLLDKSGLLEAFAAWAVIALSLLGAIVTIGLFRWERRNIKRCLWLISRAAIIESDILKKPNQQYDGMAKAEPPYGDRVPWIVVIELTNLVHAFDEALKKAIEEKGEPARSIAQGTRRQRKGAGTAGRRRARKEK